jgi:enoyl-CoA hydratase
MDYSRYEYLQVTNEGPIFTVTLNRPDALNVINGELHHELAQIFWDLDHDEACDVVILTGAGKSFSAGGDLRWVRSLAGNVVRSTEANRVGRRMQSALLDLEKPILAKVRGAAIGLGASLSLACDFVYATPDATFADPHAAVGLVAGDGGSYLWPQLIGYARARRYLLTGDRITGTQAAEIGLITEAVPDEELDAVVQAMAERMATGAKYAIRWTKAAINAGLKATSGAVAYTASMAENLTQMTDDNRIALDAFIAKEKPTFTGQ